MIKILFKVIIFKNSFSPFPPALTTGVIPLAHPETHEFRSKDRAKELHKTDIYLRR